MKRFIYLPLMMMLLFVACSKDENSLLPQEEMPLETRGVIADNVNISMTGKTVTLSWNAQVPGTGINVTLFVKGQSGNYGYYSNPNDSGSVTFSAYDPYNDYFGGKPLVAQVSAYSGSYESEEIPVMRTPDPNDPNDPFHRLCNHTLQFINDDRLSTVGVENGFLNIYTKMNNPRLIFVKVDNNVNLSYVDYRSFWYAPDPSLNYRHEVMPEGYYLSVINNYPYASTKGEARLYNSNECFILYTGPDGFPECTHYYKVTFEMFPPSSIGGQPSVTNVRNYFVQYGQEIPLD